MSEPIIAFNVCASTDPMRLGEAIEDAIRAAQRRPALARCPRCNEPLGAAEHGDADCILKRLTSIEARLSAIPTAAARVCDCLCHMPRGGWGGSD